MVARHVNTSVDAVEEWDVDKLISYQVSIGRVLKREAPKRRRRPSR